MARLQQSCYPRDTVRHGAAAAATRPSQTKSHAGQGQEQTAGGKQTPIHYKSSTREPTCRPSRSKSSRPTVTRAYTRVDLLQLTCSCQRCTASGQGNGQNAARNHTHGKAAKPALGLLQAPSRVMSSNSPLLTRVATQLTASLDAIVTRERRRRAQQRRRYSQLASPMQPD